MFLQHMLAVLRDGGLHGHRDAAWRAVPRRRRARHPRRIMIEADLLEAVIGLPANLFYGTGIPACVLVLRQRQGNQQRQAGRIARARCCSSTPTASTSRAARRTTCCPSTSRRSSTPSTRLPPVPGFSAIVPISATLRENDYNLNIRRYADNAPPPEPHDVRAHLLGGVPKAEVQAKAALFSGARAWTRWHCLSSGMPGYFDFRPELTTRQATQARGR